MKDRTNNVIYTALMLVQQNCKFVQSLICNLSVNQIALPLHLKVKKHSSINEMMQDKTQKEASITVTKVQLEKT